MTCKDCIHYDVCQMYAKFGVTDLPPENNNICELLKDKSLFIELPCKIGDTVYTVIECENTFIDEGYVALIAIEHKSGIEIYVKYESGLTYLYWVKDIGRRFFFTYEEAEAKLKEINNA